MGSVVDSTDAPRKRPHTNEGVQARFASVVGRVGSTANPRNRPMNMVAIAAHKLNGWVKFRPQLEIEESATWFLLFFVYAHGLTADELGFEWSGIIPEVTAPQASLVLALLCLAASVVVLVEPLLPSKIRRRTIAIRRSGSGQYFRRFSVLLAFVLGMATGFGLLSEKAPALSWLTDSVVYVGFLIFIVMVVKMVVLAWRDGRMAKRSAS